MIKGIKKSITLNPYCILNHEVFVFGASCKVQLGFSGA